MNTNDKVNISEEELKNIHKKLGINTSNIMNKPSTIEELVKRETGMVIVEPTQSFRANYNINGVPSIEFKKGEPVVMTLGDFNNHLFNKEYTGLYKPSKCKFSQNFRRYRGENLDNKSLLIWRFGGVGDIVIVQSIIKYLKHKYPTCKISFATAPHNSTILYSYPDGLIDNKYTMPFKKKLLDEHDYHLTFINSIEGCEESKYTNYFELIQRVANVNYNTSDFMPELIPIKKIDEELKKYLPDNLVVVHMNPTSPLRTMSYEKWRTIIYNILKLGYKVGIIDSLASSKNVETLIKSCGFSKEHVMNLASYSLDFNYAVSIVNNSKCVLSIDSGIAHIAGALKVPNVCCYGAFRHEIITGNFYKNTIGIQVPVDFNICGKYPCCSNQDMSVCPFVSNNRPAACMDFIDDDLVVESFKKLMEKTYNE